MPSKAPQRRTSPPKTILKALGGAALVLTVFVVLVTILFGVGGKSETETSTRAAIASDPSYRDGASYYPIDERELAGILKDPAEKIGRRVILHAEIWQFDPLTGPDQFLAHIGPTGGGGILTESALVIGNAAELEPLVEGDEVVIYAVVDGDYTYTSQANFEITVPKFQIGIIQPASP
ncbi:protein PASTA domain-containing protein [Rhodococcus triatomae BKS 15-14]|nr:protein PASTA domain-containing protein [Rhodococcus triatomae BKS 15-14]